MAYIPKRPCAHAGCKNYTTHGLYCDLHRKEVKRGTTSKFVSFYKSTRWEKARNNFLLNHI